MGLSLTPAPRGYFTTATGSRPMYKIFCSALPLFWRDADLLAFATLANMHPIDMPAADREASIGRATIDTASPGGTDRSKGWGWLTTSSEHTALALLRSDNSYSVRGHTRPNGASIMMRFKISHESSPSDSGGASRAAGVCFSCLLPGHAARDCTNPRACQRCGSPAHTKRACPVTPPVCHRCGDPGHTTDHCHWSDEQVTTDCANREGGAGRCPAFLPLLQLRLDPPPVGNHRAQANRAQWEAGWSPPQHQPFSYPATPPPGASTPLAAAAVAPPHTTQGWAPPLGPPNMAPPSVAVVVCPPGASPESRALYSVLSQTQQAQNNLLSFASFRMDASDLAIASLRTAATEAQVSSNSMLTMLASIQSLLQMQPPAGPPPGPSAYPGASSRGPGATPPQ